MLKLMCSGGENQFQFFHFRSAISSKKKSYYDGCQLSNSLKIINLCYKNLKQDPLYEAKSN